MRIDNTKDASQRASAARTPVLYKDPCRAHSPLVVKNANTYHPSLATRAIDPTNWKTGYDRYRCLPHTRSLQRRARDA